ncbi:helix-turn-helix domain-containing protein [Planococcus sp. 107-1]|uniref:helix-turn-helix domain-containing protein n=1 Tax=Planococcus sp. 107-1 TaxID=2908840 RepID=UPI001F38C723|nr:helix-turn-helix domain-containing protein [Planococcus sp. 107-1]UJF27448.1 helix-turn-helix domain-containing protein [Planococcus sp. 107-1]
MIQVQIDEAELKTMYLAKLEERMKEIEGEVFFMSSKELCRYVGMSWTNVVTHLLSDPEYPACRLGNKWLFPRKEVSEYMQKYYEAVRNDTGDIKTFKRMGS